MSSCAQGVNGQTSCAMPSPSKNAIAIGIGTGVSILGALLLLILLIVWQSKKKRNAMNVVVDDLEDRMEMVAESSNTAWRYTYDKEGKAAHDQQTTQEKSLTVCAPSAAVHTPTSEVMLPSTSATNGDSGDNKERQSESRSADGTEELIGVPVLLSTNDTTLQPSSEQPSLNDQSSNSASQRTSNESRPREQVTPS
jgi:hypothetical protein